MTNEKIINYLKKHGERGAKVLERLGAVQLFVEAIATEVGKELLSEHMNRYDELLNYVCENGAASDDLKLEELKLLDCTIKNWSRKICYYHSKIKEIENG